MSLTKTVLLIGLSASSLLAQTPVTTGCDNATTTMQYFGGGIMHNPMTIYKIFYGPAWDPSHDDYKLINDFVDHFPLTTMWQNLHLYCDDNANYVTNYNYVTISSTVLAPAYRFGTQPSAADLQQLIQDGIDNTDIPADSDAIYMIFLDSGTFIPGSVCAYHSVFIEGAPYSSPYHPSAPYTALHYTVNKADGCTNYTAGPNGNATADNLATLIAHEWAETVTDPQGQLGYGFGWESLSGEIADICETATPSTFSWNSSLATMTVPTAIANSVITGESFSNRGWYVKPIWFNRYGTPHCTNFNY